MDILYILSKDIKKSSGTQCWAHFGLFFQVYSIFTKIIRKARSRVLRTSDSEMESYVLHWLSVCVFSLLPLFNFFHKNKPLDRQTIAIGLWVDCRNGRTLSGKPLWLRNGIVCFKIIWYMLRMTRLPHMLLKSLCGSHLHASSMVVAFAPHVLTNALPTQRRNQLWEYAIWQTPMTQKWNEVVPKCIIRLLVSKGGS